MIDGKEALLKAAKRRYQVVKVDDVGEFRIQSLNGRELAEFVSKFNSGQVDSTSVDNLVSLIGMCLVDDLGVRLFSEEEAKQLADLEFGVLVQLANACQEHNRLTDKQQDRLAKN